MKIVRKLPCVPVLMILMLLPASSIDAGTTSFRCGNNYISDIGDHMHVVRKHCGEPAVEQKIGEKEVSNHNFMYLTEWIYEKDQGIYILTFEGSRLIKKEFIK
jgi:Protein of unknown function (DUF2845)